MRKTRFASLGLALVVVTGLLLSPALLGAQQSDSPSDAKIEGAVVNALGTTPGLMDQQITAATIEGTVTLSGSVPDAASKKQAGALVKKIDGVKAVENNLEIQAAQSAPVSTPDTNLPAGSEPITAPVEPQVGAPQQNQMQQGEPEPAPEQQPTAPNRRRAYQGNQLVSGPVTIPPGTLLRLRTSESVDNRRSKPGDIVEFTAASDIYAGGALAIPRGAVMHGIVEDPINLNKSAAQQSDAKKNQQNNAQNNQQQPDQPDGRKTKYAIAMRLTDVVLEGQVYPIKTDAWTLVSPSTAPRTANNVVSGALLGTFIGAIAGRGTGAAIGAVAGGTAGAIASAATPPPHVVLPIESLVSFHLQEGITVSPVSQQEAQRLASAANQGARDSQPTLYRRRSSPYYPPPPPPPPYYYGGGQVYYVP
jgi:hypothetical protein